VIRRVLLLGATGVFGSRLAALLSAIPDIDLVLAARGLDALNDLKRTLEAQGEACSLSVQPFDRRRPEALAALRPWLVIDAAGPFQDSDYGLALAAVRAGAHYLDLADGRAFVAGFPAALQAAAARAGVLAVTGASSTPALTHAALGDLTKEWRRLDTVVAVISPGGQAPRGLSVVEAILSYVGRPVRAFRDGHWGLVPGWSASRRVDMPGLGARWASLCETPDLDLLPQQFTISREALFLAGLDPPVMHLGLALLGLLVRWRLIGSLRPAARMLRALSGPLSWFSSDRGGMIVQAQGLDAQGVPIRARWALWAEANSGPSTPAAPAAAWARKLLEGGGPPSGAYACAGLLSLEDIVGELGALPIRWRTDESHPDSPVLFRRLLGRRFAALPSAVQAVHGAAEPAVSSGRAVVRAGRSTPARLMCGLLGLPTTGHCDVEVRMSPDSGGETWTRRFGRSRFSSRLVGTRRLGVFEERFGLLRFRFELHPTSSGVIWAMTGWSLLGVKLPRALGPRVLARADQADGRYRFRVVVGHPWLGLLFAYRGDLRPVD
jgi:hypothetical protein